MTGTLLRFIPQSAVKYLRAIYASDIWFLVDLFEKYISKKNPFTPPLKIRLHSTPFYFAKEYERIANNYFSYVKRYCHLKTTDSLLDVGCGSGHLAVPLTKYLSEKGRYEGFDIDKKVVDYAKENIFPSYPNFRFSYADVFNKLYNPEGKLKASDYRFPYKDDSFDVVVLISVFTHMLPVDMINYLAEIRRVLKKGGCCFITFFLINAESIRQLKEKKTDYQFPYIHKRYRSSKLDCPESAVAYNLLFLLKLYRSTGLHIQKPILYGNWRRQIISPLAQDVIVALK